MLRLWYPLPQKKHIYLQRFTLYKKLDNHSQSNHIKVKHPYRWKNIENIKIDPEHSELCLMLRGQNEQQVGFAGKELTEDEFIIDPSNADAQGSSQSNRKTQGLLVSGAQFSIEDQAIIYRYFFTQTFPYFYMTLLQFEELMQMIGWKKDAIPDLFQAFKSKSSAIRDFMSYPEFISGLAACEPATPHGDLCGEARCKYIFRFYDKNHDGNLVFDEFSNMVKDILEMRGDIETSVEEEARKSAKIFGSDQCDMLSLSDFLSGVGQLKFRGTSMLLRSPKSVLEVLSSGNRHVVTDLIGSQFYSSIGLVLLIKKYYFGFLLI